MKKKLVIFDFDGVLVNTHDVSFALNQKTNPHLTQELYSQMSHGKFYASYESNTPLLTFTPNPEFTNGYREGLYELNIPASIKVVITYLSEKYHLAICSSAFDETISEFLESQDIAHHFNDVLGVLVHKSKVIKLKQLLEKYNLQKEDAVFITDTLGDVLEAHEVGIKSIAETWGLHDRETLEKGNPEIIIDDPSLLEQTIKKVLND